MFVTYKSVCNLQICFHIFFTAVQATATKSTLKVSQSPMYLRLGPQPVGGGGTFISPLPQWKEVRSLECALKEILRPGLFLSLSLLLICNEINRTSLLMLCHDVLCSHRPQTTGLNDYGLTPLKPWAIIKLYSFYFVYLRRCFLLLESWITQLYLAIDYEAFCICRKEDF